jgi:hypothetical protein
MERKLVVPEPVAATVWFQGEYRSVTDLDDPGALEEIERAREADGPVWIELALSDLSDAERQWFEGSLNVWQSVERPHFDWRRVEPIFDRVGLSLPVHPYRDDEPAETSLIRVLPHLWARGILRAIKDLVPHVTLDESARLFPTVGFWKGPAGEDAETNAEAFAPVPPITIIRTSVGVIRNCVISVRLPDFICAGGPTDAEGIVGLSRDLMIPERFLPFREPDAHEIAEAIAHHQAATARAITEPLRGQLRNLERQFTDQVEEEDDQDFVQTRRDRLKQRVAPPVSEDPRLRASEAISLIDQLTEVLVSLERQVARLLRRFGSFGDDQPMTGTERQLARLLRRFPFVEDDQEIGDVLVPRETKLRNQFALDELRGLTGDARLAREVIKAEADAREREEREKFQFVAAILGAVILFPSLIAGIYGANVELPGPRETGALPLMFFVIGFGLLGFYLVNETWLRWTPSPDGEKLRKRTLFAALGVLVAATVLLIVISI